MGQEDPLEKEMATQSVFLPGESHGQRSLADYSPWITKSWTRLSDIYYQHDLSTVDLYHLTEVVFVTFHTVKLLFYPLSTLYLWEEVTMNSPHLRGVGS